MHANPLLFDSGIGMPAYLLTGPIAVLPRQSVVPSSLCVRRPWAHVHAVQDHFSWDCLEHARSSAGVVTREAQGTCDHAANEGRYGCPFHGQLRDFPGSTEAPFHPACSSSGVVFVPACPWFAALACVIMTPCAKYAALVLSPLCPDGLEPFSGARAGRTRALDYNPFP